MQTAEKTRHVFHNSRRQNRIRRTGAEWVFVIFNTIFLTAFCLITLYPFWYVLVLSLNEAQDSMLGGIWFWPREFTLDNYHYVLSSPQVGTAYLISISRTVLGSLYSLVVTGFAAYFASKRHLPFRGFIITFLMIPMFVSGTIVTNYIVMAKLGLLNNYLVYILPSGFSMFYMIIMRTFINDLPPSLEESAKLDGAGYLTIFFRLVIPLCKPVIATVVLFTAVGLWLDFNTNLMYITKKNLTCLQYLLYSVEHSSQAARDIGQHMSKNGGAIAAIRQTITPEAVKYATLMVTTLPILFIYPFFQKYFTKGVMVGAIKE